MMPTLPEISAGAPSCPECGGSGFLRTTDAAGNPVSRRCACQLAVQADARIRRAEFPAAFEKAIFGNFQPSAGTETAKVMAMRYIEEFIPGATNRGLLFTGTVGTGKTHLAIATAKALARDKSVKVRFVHIGELLERLKASFNEDSTDSRDAIWIPIFNAELIVIDELGAAKVSDFVFETQETLIGTLYNTNKPVIVTTNLENIGPGESSAKHPAANDYARVTRPETLGDRVGARMFSRLQQMCQEVHVYGPDWRAKRK
jgi:DNA replication protein DnaC